MSKRILTTMIAFLFVFGLALVTSLPANALGKVKCDNNPSGVPPVKIGNYDPIINHNQPPPSAHEHQFFGSYGWLNLPNPNTAGLNDLRAGPSDCRVAIDTAGYWSPTLRYTTGPNAGKLIPMQQFTAYYRPATGVGGPDFGPAVTMPQNTRLASNVYNWTCGQNSGARSAPKPYIPDCTGLDGSPGKTLTAHVDLPTCWNGNLPNHPSTEVGNTSDNADYATKNGVLITKGACPAGYQGVTAIRETFQFDYQGDGTDVALSDEVPGQRPGTGMHADFFQAWQMPQFNTWLDHCVRNQAQYTAAECQP